MPFFPILIVMALADPPTPACTGPFDRAAVVACARANSPWIRADLERLEAARGQHDAARVVLPSNPQLAVTMARRSNTSGDVALNVSGTVSQELEIGGQRRKRMQIADADAASIAGAATITEREVVAEALLAYFDVLAAQAELEVTERSLVTARRVEELARERGRGGLGAVLDEDLALAERTRVEEQAVLARGRQRVAQATLAAALGLDPGDDSPQAQGELSPLAVPTTDPGELGARAADTRPELASARARHRAELARIGLLRRSRVPNPSLSFFVQQDGLDEQVIGGGLSFPLPLPAPLGRTARGEISSSRARARAADESVSAVARQVQTQAAVAASTFEARRQALDVYPSELVVRAQQTLDDLAAEIAAGRLFVRDALVAQQALQDLLLRRVEARHALARASVELALVAGLSFEGGGR